MVYNDNFNNANVCGWNAAQIFAESHNTNSVSKFCKPIIHRLIAVNACLFCLKLRRYGNGLYCYPKK